jgi:uncharacterized protein (TIGR01777 family)
MQILITGGTGLIGRKLCKLLHEKGHQITVFSRHPESVPEKCGAEVKVFASLDEWQSDTVFDVVINLAGEPIADKAWTVKRRQVLLDSRVALTKKLIDKIACARVKPAVLLSGSAIGYYGNRHDELLDESSIAGQGFAADLCIAWEQAALQVQGVRVCLLRTGLVLSRDGGILAKMLLPLGMGVRFGRGMQWMSWIHIDDYTQLILRLIDDEQISGPVNMTAPTPVINRDFIRTLVDVRHGLAAFSAPSALLNLMLGERAALLLEGQRVLPNKVLATGYAFRYSDLSSALGDLLSA